MEVKSMSSSLSFVCFFKFDMFPCRRTFKLLTQFVGPSARHISARPLVLSSPVTIVDTSCIAYIVIIVVSLCIFVPPFIAFHRFSPSKLLSVRGTLINWSNCCELINLLTSLQLFPCIIYVRVLRRHSLTLSRAIFSGNIGRRVNKLRQQIRNINWNLTKSISYSFSGFESEILSNLNLPSPISFELCR